MITVLLVEDNSLLLEVLADALEAYGYTVAQAHDGVEALALLTQGDIAPDVILSDISLPRMDGYELLAAVRRLEACRHVAFFWVTAHQNADLNRKAQELGADGVVNKPFRIEDVTALIEQRLHRTA